MLLRICMTLVLLGLAKGVEAQGFLRGNPAAMIEQARKAQELELDRMRNPAMVRKYVKAGYLVEIKTGPYYIVDDQVSFPYARPSLKLFLDRFGKQHVEECGERFVIVSLTRPLNRQPRNASSNSVHPVGMSVDLRMPRNRKCFNFMVDVFFHLEREVKPRAIQVTREYRPPHFHIAVYPDNYRRYVASQSKPKAKAKPKPSVKKKAPAKKPVPKKKRR